MKDKDEDLLREISRRNWLILTVLVILSLFWRSLPVTLGVAGGGLLAVASYFWLYRSLRRMMAEPSRWSARRFQVQYVVRLAVLAAVLFVLVALVKVHPIALAAGLSVVVINLIWAAVKRTF